MKKVTRIGLMIFLIFTIIVVCTSCSMIVDIAKTREEKRRELFDQMSQIETTGNYAFIYETGYYSKDKEIKFQNLVEEKLENDGKIVKDLDVTFIHYEDDTIQFFAKYKTDRNFLGLNKQNKRFVVGTISLIDYTVTPYYFKSKYEEILDSNLSKTHHIVTVGTMKKRTSNKEYTKRYVTIDRKSGDIKEWTNELDALESIGECTERYQNPINIENNTKYIPTPSVTDVMEKSSEMKEIIEILGGETKTSTISPNLFTNGEE